MFEIWRLCPSRSVVPPCFVHAALAHDPIFRQKTRAGVPRLHFDRVTEVYHGFPHITEAGARVLRNKIVNGPPAEGGRSTLAVFFRAVSLDESQQDGQNKRIPWRKWQVDRSESSMRKADCLVRLLCKKSSEAVPHWISAIELAHALVGEQGEGAVPEEIARRAEEPDLGIRLYIRQMSRVMINCLRFRPEGGRMGVGNDFGRARGQCL